MSQDILIRGSRATVCNGAYGQETPDATATLAKTWLSYDRLCVVRTAVDASTDVQYWTVAAADYDFVNLVASTVSSKIYFRAPVLIDVDDEQERTPWDPALVWEDRTELPIASVVRLSTFDSDNVMIDAADPVTGDDGGVTTITKYTDIMTGNTWQEISVVYEKTVSVIQSEERVIPIQPVIGSVYRFRFVRDFKYLGYLAPWQISQTDIGKTVRIDGDEVTITADNITTYLNKVAYDKAYHPSGGIYRIDRILSYQDLLLTGVDLYNNLYAQCSLPRTTYDMDLPTFEAATFYLLSCPIEKTRSFYVPETLFKTSPDSSIDQYDKLLLSIELGVHSDPDMIEDMHTTLGALLEKRWGIIGGSGSKVSIKVASYDSTWMNSDDYALLEKQRRYVIKHSTIKLSELFCFTDTNPMHTELTRLKNQLKAYEEIIAQRSNS